MNRSRSPLAKIGKTLQIFLLLFYALFALFPLLWMFIMSIKPDSQMLTTTFIFTPTLENYATVLQDRKSTRLNSSHQIISYAVFCLKKKKQKDNHAHKIV